MAIPNDRDLLLRIAVGKNRLFGSTFNTTISALIVLEEIFPKANELRALLVAHADSTKSSFVGNQRNLLVEIYTQGLAYEDRLKIERPDLYQSKLRLRIYYNRYAAMRLPRDFFIGELDVHIEPDELWDEPIHA